MTKKEENLAFLFLGFILWIEKVCVEKKIKKIYFFTREGIFFKKIYDEIMKRDLHFKNSLQVEVLEVSRIATFAPSIKKIGIEELKRMWGLYQTQSMNACLISLSLNPDEFNMYFDAYGLNQYEMIKNPEKDVRVNAFFSDKEVQNKINRQLLDKRELLEQYCKLKGIKQGEKDRIAVVDIGWRGTIQDNLCRIFPDIEWNGFYLCLDQFINEQPINAIKYGYLNQINPKIVLRYPTPIEMICNSAEGSVVGYSERNGIIYVEHVNEEKENMVHKLYTNNLQTMILRRIAFLCSKELTQEQLLTEGVCAIHRFLLYPPKVAARAFFSLNHNETFGTGGFVSKRCTISKKLFFQSYFDKEARKKLKVCLYKTSWAQAYLTIEKRYIVRFVYNLILKIKMFINIK